MTLTSISPVQCSCCCSVAESCLTLCDLMDCSTPGYPVLHYLLVFAQLMSIESMMPSNYLILCRPLLLLPSVLTSIKVFSNESVLHIRWPKYWNLSFSISPSNEYLGLICMYTSNSWGRSPFKLAICHWRIKSLPTEKRLLTSLWLFLSFFRWLSTSCKPAQCLIHSWVPQKQ